jgi:hypothetical protein
MVNKRDKSIGTEATAVTFVKEKDVFVQQNTELYKRNIKLLIGKRYWKHGKVKMTELFQGQ